MQNFDQIIKKSISRGLSYVLLYDSCVHMGMGTWECARMRERMRRIAGGCTREHECTRAGMHAKIDRRKTEVAIANTNVMASYFYRLKDQRKPPN